MIQRKYNDQRHLNARLLSKMQAVQGNIQVCCRIRPPTSYELMAKTRTVVEPLTESEVGFYNKRPKEWASFGFDQVRWTAATYL